MNKNLLKTPSFNDDIGGVKLSELPSLDDSGFNYPIFCFKHLHCDYDFETCKVADKKFLKGFVTKIKMLSDSTWSTIQLSDKHGVGSEKISKDSLKVSVPNSITKDVKDFLSFYFAGSKGRIIGYRNTNILHVIYIDTKLDVYTH